MFENGFGGMMNGIFGKVAPGMCRISMNGGIAVKTANGYKEFDVDSGRLTNCDSFVLDVGDDMFFCVPTNKASKGDIILVGGKPKCVISAGKDTIKVLGYEDGQIQELVPERHMFLGETYFYGKIVSIFGKRKGSKKKGMSNIMKYMFLSQMMKGKGTDGSSSGIAQYLPFMLMSGNGGFMDGLFDFMDEVDDDVEATDGGEE